MKCQLKSMSGTILGTCCKMSATVQNKFTTNCQLLAIYQWLSGIIPRNVRYMKLSGIEMSYTRPIAGIHETVRYWNVRHTWNCQVLKCHIHDLWQLYIKLSGIEMSYTWPVAGIHKTVRYWNVMYMTCGRYGWNINAGSGPGNLVALWHTSYCLQQTHFKVSNNMHQTHKVRTNCSIIPTNFTGSSLTPTCPGRCLYFKLATIYYGISNLIACAVKNEVLIIPQV